MWHIKEVRRLGMVQRSFTALRQFGSITIRTNAKNSDIPPPKIIAYYENGEREGIDCYLALWNMTKELGSE
jgi:hypothetical protein